MDGPNNFNDDDIFKAQRERLNQINQDEDKLKNDIKKGVGIIIIITAIVLTFVLLFILTQGKGKDSDGGDNPPVVTDQRIGKDEIGYVTVPGDWSQTIDVTSSSTFMYASPDNNYIIALEALTNTNKTPAEIADELANSLVGGEYKEVSVRTDTIYNYEAYLVSDFSTKTSKWSLNWLFVADDNVIHYIAFETPNLENDFMEIPYTFRLTKEIEQKPDDSQDNTTEEQINEEEKNTNE